MTLRWAAFEARGLWTPAVPTAIAVSGGSDSLALMLQTCEALVLQKPHIVTVDHGLRPEAQQEAAFVGQIAVNLGCPHSVLRVTDLAPGPNLQARARAARYDALTRWARQTGIKTIALGHTQTDVAETVLMRLARGSGVAGLAEMEDAFVRDGVQFLRPALDESRDCLRDYLTRKGQRWIDDPSNENDQFHRVRLRDSAGMLADLGLTSQRLALAAQNLRRANDAIDWQVRSLCQNAAHLDGPDVLIDPSLLAQAPEEPKFRLLAQLAQWMSNADYPPRFDALQAASQRSGTFTLHGVLWQRTDTQLRLSRELAAAPPPAAKVWDGRWLGQGQIGALGSKGIAQCPDWRATGLPRASVLASPALWDGDALIAAPFANFGARDSLRLVPPAGLPLIAR